MGELLNSLFANVGLVELLVFIGGIVFFAARLEENARASKELINTELRHVIDLMELNNKSIKEDIARLEKKSDETNHVKERVALLEASFKSAHHRIDNLERGYISNEE